jgi:hypothetical protein
MPHYRAYIIDEHGQFVSAIDFDCADDEEAKEHARGLDGRKVELWRELSLEQRESGNLDTLSISDDTAHGQPGQACDLRLTSFNAREASIGRRVTCVSLRPRISELIGYIAEWYLHA